MERPDTGKQRRQTLARLKIGFVVLVAASAGLVSIYGNGSPMVILIAIAVGSLAGLALAWLVFPSPGQITSDRSRGRQ